jgi:hypothetical protein
LIFISRGIFGQFQVDAGNDTILCLSDTKIIGGNPTASGGLEPYTYKWTTNYSSGSITLNASYFLDDVTKANPSIINYVPNQQILKFKLQVKDNSGAILYDSIHVRLSIFKILLILNDRVINQGDTIALQTVIRGGIDPLSYAWSPNYNISDPSVFRPIAWPDISTDYIVIVTDSIGCKMTDTINVLVNPLTINQNNSNDCKSTLFPNPITGESLIHFQINLRKKYSLRVFNTDGQIILMDNIDSDCYEIGPKITNEGIYFYFILEGDKIVSSGKIIKE